MGNSKSVKLSTKSAIFFSMTSMIGAGIFIKTQTLNVLAHNQLAPVICLFFFFLINIFAFCYVLLKIIPSQTGNMGFMEWSKQYCNPRIHCCFSNFIRFFYHPISLFLFSFYGITGIIGNQHIGIIASMFISLVLVVFLMFLNFISFKWSKRLQMALWALVLIPLIVLPILGMIQPGNVEEIIKENQEIPEKATGLNSVGPWMLLISGLPAAIFIYDGFYGVTALKDQLEKPKTLAFSVIASIGLVTLLYLNVIIGFNIGDPVSASYKNFAFLKNRPVLKDFFEILKSCASLLTLNSIAMSNTSQLTAMYDTHKYEDVIKFRKLLFYKKTQDERFETKFTIWLYLMFKTLISFVIIGTFLFLFNRFTNGDVSIIVDSLADIVSVFVFVILVGIIIGSFKNKENLEHKSKSFKFCAFVSGAFIIAALIYMIVSYIVGTTGFAGDDVLGSWMKLIFLLTFLIGSSFRQITSFVVGKMNRKRNTLYPNKHKGSIIVIN